MKVFLVLLAFGVKRSVRCGLTTRSTGPIAAGRHLGYKSLAQMPTRHNGPVSSNVRPQMPPLWLRDVTRKFHNTVVMPYGQTNDKHQHNQPKNFKNVHVYTPSQQIQDQSTGGATAQTPYHLAEICACSFGCASMPQASSPTPHRACSSQASLALQDTL